MGAGGLYLVILFAISSSAFGELAVGVGAPTKNPDYAGIVEKFLQLTEYDQLPKEYQEKVTAESKKHEDVRAKFAVQMQVMREYQSVSLKKTFEGLTGWERAKLLDELMKWVKWDGVPPTQQAEATKEWFPGVYSYFGGSAVAGVDSLFPSMSDAEKRWFVERHIPSFSRLPSEAKRGTAYILVASDEGFPTLWSMVKHDPNSKDNEYILSAFNSAGYLSKATLTNAGNSKYVKELAELYANPKLAPTAQALLTNRFIHSGRGELLEAVAGNIAASPSKVEDIAKELHKVSPNLVYAALAKRLGIDPSASLALMESLGAPVLGGKDLLPSLTTEDAGARLSIANYLLKHGISLGEPPPAALENFLKALMLEKTSPLSKIAAMKLMAKYPFASVIALIPQTFEDPIQQPGLSGGYDGYLEWTEEIPKFMGALPKKLSEPLVAPLLEKLRTSDSSKNSFVMAVEALAEIGGKVAATGLVEALEKIPEDRLSRRSLARGLTKTLGELSDPDRRELLPRYHALFKADAASEGAHDVTRLLRFQLPPEKRAEVDKVMGRRPKKIADACVAACKIYDQVDTWAKDELFLKPEGYVDMSKPIDDWEIATKSLASLFMLSAAPYCDPKRERIKKVAQWLKVKEGTRRAAPNPEKLAEQKRHMLRVLEELKKNAKTEAELAGVAAAQSFFYQVGDRDERPDRSMEVYGKNFLSLLLKRWESSPANQATALQVNRLLMQDLVVLNQYGREEGPIDNSLGTMHVILSSMIGSQTPEMLGGELERLKGAFAEYKKKFADQFGEEADYMLPYTYSGHHRDTVHPLESRGTVPMGYFSLYQNAKTNEEKTLYRERLVRSLEFYDRDFWDYFSLAGRKKLPEGFHDRVMGAQIAPYFGPATVPYIAAFTKAILDDKNASQEQKDRARKARDGVKDQLLRKLQDNGLFVAQDPEHFQSAAVYDNPQVGLAFLSLLDPDTDKCPGGLAVASTGILDPGIAAGLGSLATKAAGH